jgi:DNA invertase Pin-like site-specific DNA recombinase
MKTALYARVSTKDKRQDTENQLAQLRDFALNKGWEIVHEYIDHETGTRDARPEFQAMFADASRRRFDLLLFWALDRLSREGALETLQHLNRLTSYGVAYKSFTEEYLDSCGIFREAVIAIMATIAKQESIRIGERTRAGHERARARGIKIGRPALDLNIAQIASLRDQGCSIREISEQLGIGVGSVHRALKTVPKHCAKQGAKNPRNSSPSGKPN